MTFASSLFYPCCGGFLLFAAHFPCALIGDRIGMMVQAEAAPPGRFPLLLIEDGEAAILALAFTQPPVFPT